MNEVATQKNIPKGWQEKKLGDVCDIVNGSTPKRSVSEYWENGNIPWFTVDDIRSNGRIISKTNQSITDKALKGTSVKLLPEDSVLLCCTASLGEVALTKIPLTTNQQFNGLVSKDKKNLFPYYLFYSAQKFGENLKSKSGKTTINFLSVGSLSKEKVLIPPIKEQQKIAEILGTVDEDVARTQEVIETTEKLKRGLMQSILSFGNKENVKYLAFGDIGKVSMCKRIFKKETSDNGDIPFYKIGTFGKEPDSFISQEIFDNYRNKFSFPKIGDILLSASGTIGRKVIYDGRPAYFQDSNIIWLEHDESKILNSFLFHLYDTIKWQTEGSTIKRLYNDIFLKKIIPVPPIDKQKQIVEVLSAVDEKILINKKLKAKLTLLKKGLMQDLLSGEVRVKI